MLLAILSPLLGIFGSLLPNIVRIFERKQEIQYELKLTEIKIAAAKEQAVVEKDIAGIKADVDEGQSVRAHDSNIDGGKYINTLRASIRPVITYLFFFLFVMVKVSAAYVMITSNVSVPEVLRAIWDTETMALFSTILAFWFGSRVHEKTDNRITQTQSITVKPAPKK